MASSMNKNDSITSEVLFFVTDCLVDELEPDESKANSMKARLRRVSKNFLSYVQKREAEKLLEQEEPKSGLKRKDLDSHLPEVCNSLDHREPADSEHEHGTSGDAQNGAIRKASKKANAPEGKPAKKRKTTAHTAYMSYGMGMINELVMNSGMFIPGPKRMQILNSYKQKKPEALMKQFENDYSDAVHEINEGSEKLPKGYLYGKFRDVDKIKSYTVHPLFSDFADFTKEFLGYQESTETKAKVNGGQEADKTSLSDTKAWKSRKTLEKKNGEGNETEGKAGKAKSSTSLKADKQVNADKERASKKPSSEYVTKAGATRGAKKESLVKTKDAAPPAKPTTKAGSKKKDGNTEANTTEEEYSNDEEAGKLVEGEGSSESEESGEDDDSEGDSGDDE